MTSRCTTWARRTACGAILAGIAVVAAPSAPAAAQDYPDRPVQLVVPFNPGGGSDRIARTLESRFEEEFGQRLAFDYKPGAGGHIGISGLARASGDGYTIGTFNTPDIAIGPLTGAAQYDLDDFTLLGQIASDPSLLVANPATGLASVEDLVERARAEPGRLSLAVAGAKGGTHLAALRFIDEAGLDMNVVIFPGGSDLAAAVLGGQVDVGMAGIGPFLGSLEEVNVLATLSDERHDALPDVPTLPETGIDVTASVGRILLAPVIEDEAVAQRLREGIAAMYEAPGLHEDLAAIGQTPDWIPGDELAAQLEAYQAEAASVIEAHGL